MQERVTELEIKLAHNEQALNELSDVLYRQQQLIDRLEQRMEALQQRAEAGNVDGAGPNAPDDKPPHY
jgi:SlyX protein